MDLHLHRVHFLVHIRFQLTIWLNMNGLLGTLFSIEENTKHMFCTYLTALSQSQVGMYRIFTSNLLRCQIVG